MFERNRIADTLRSARERQGCRSRQAAAAAGIPLQYVGSSKVESNVGVGVSDELYLIPFFRRYARFVGLDAEELLPEFLGVVQRDRRRGQPHPVPTHLPDARRRLWRAAAVLLAIAVATSSCSSGRRPIGRNGDESTLGATANARQRTRVEVAVVAQPTPDACPARPPIAAITPAFEQRRRPGAPVATATADPAPAGGGRRHELRIVAAEEAWLSLGIDDEPKRNILLRPGESTHLDGGTLHADGRQRRRHHGRLDGRELPPLGRSGRCVRTPPPTTTD